MLEKSLWTQRWSRSPSKRCCMVLLCFKLFISLACSYQVTGQQSGLRCARTQRVAGFGTRPGLREYGQNFLVLEGCLNDTLNDTSTTPGKHKRRATAYPSIRCGQRVGPAPPPMLVGGLEPASKSMSWSLWGGAASTPFLPAFLAFLPYCLTAFLPSCLPAFLPSCLPAFLPSCLPAFCLLPLLPSFFFCPASLPLLPCLPSSSSLPLPPFLFLPSSSSLPLPPFLFLPSLPPSFFPCPILPCSLTPWIPLSLPPHPSSLRPFTSCFLCFSSSALFLHSFSFPLPPFLDINTPVSETLQNAIAKHNVLLEIAQSSLRFCLSLIWICFVAKETAHFKAASHVLLDTWGGGSSKFCKNNMHLAWYSVLRGKMSSPRSLT